MSDKKDMSGHPPCTGGKEGEEDSGLPGLYKSNLEDRLDHRAAAIHPPAVGAHLAPLVIPQNALKPVAQHVHPPLYVVLHVSTRAAASS